MRLVFLAVLAGLAAVLGCSSVPTGAPKKVVKVATAADLRFAFPDVVEAMRRRIPELTVETTYEASGHFFARLRNRADYDLFLSADVDYPRRLAEEGLASEAGPFVYAVGHLAVWARAGSPLDVEKAGLRVLLDPAVRKVAIANPRFAPYGRAAEAALKSQGLYEQVKGRLVFGESVTHAAQLASTAAADVAVVSLSLARAPALREGKYKEVPADACPRLEQAGVVLSCARDRAAAESVRDFLLGEEGQGVLRRYGFSPP